MRLAGTNGGVTGKTLKRPLPQTKSCIRKREFSLDRHLYSLNVFIPLGRSKKGRYHILILTNETVDWSSLEISDSVIEHSTECKQFFINGPESSIVGSLFVVSERKLVFEPYAIQVVTPKLVGDFENTEDSDLGGVLVYKDIHANVLAVPSKLPNNSFTVIP